MRRDSNFTYLHEIFACFKWLMRLSLCIWITSYFSIDRLPPSSLIRPELANAPVQNLTTPETFNLQYQGLGTTVKTVATYSIYGLVVSHNKPTSFFDITHDKYTIDTRDLCVIWGSNLENNTHHQFTFKSGDWTCYVNGENYSLFNPEALSNNHLIT